MKRTNPSSSSYSDFSHLRHPEALPPLSFVQQHVQGQTVNGQGTTVPYTFPLTPSSAAPSFSTPSYSSGYGNSPAVSALPINESAQYFGGLSRDDLLGLMASPVFLSGT